MTTLRTGVLVLALAGSAVLAGPNWGGIDSTTCAIARECAGGGNDSNLAQTALDAARLRAEIRAAMGAGAGLQDATCSGGANGGMDATGNECNDWKPHDEPT